MGTSFASKGSTNLTQRVKNKRAYPLEKGVRQGNGQSVCSLVQQRGDSERPGNGVLLRWIGSKQAVAEWLIKVEQHKFVAQVHQNFLLLPFCRYLQSTQALNFLFLHLLLYSYQETAKYLLLFQKLLSKNLLYDWEFIYLNQLLFFN